MSSSLLLLLLVASEPKLVTIGGAVTETVFALGNGHLVAGVDSSSVMPSEAKKLPQVGYQGAFSAEGVLSLKPTLVLLSGAAGPPAAVRALKSSGVPVLSVTDSHTVEGAKEKIRAIAKALGVPERGEAMVTKIDSDLLAAMKSSRPQRVLFIYSRGAGAVSVAGQKTAAAAMIQLAGGLIPFTFEGYRPLTAEGVLLSKPDVVLLTALGLEGSGGIEGVLALPGMSDTPAGKVRRVVSIEDLALLGFGPRVGEAVAELSKLLATP